MANTHSNAKVAICATAQATRPAGPTEYAALTWVDIGGVTRMGEVGTKSNILSLDMWSTGFSDKQKGISDAGSPELEVARDTTDDGQDALRTASFSNLSYAFRITYDDKLTSGGTGTVIYNWGIIGGPRRPQGRNEDFILEIFDLGFKAHETVVANS